MPVSPASLSDIGLPAVPVICGAVSNVLSPLSTPVGAPLLVATTSKW